MRKLIQSTICFCTLLLFIPQTALAMKWYEVDLIVFANQSPKWQHSEYWREPPEQYPEIPEETIKFEEVEYSRQHSFQRLNEVTADRHKMLQGLKNGGAYRVLFSSSWRQQIPSRGRAVPFLIKGGEAFDNRNELEGTIKLHLGRYLHIDAALWLSQFMLREEAQEKGLLPKAFTDSSTFLSDSASEQSIDYQSYGEQPGESRYQSVFGSSRHNNLEEASASYQSYHHTPYVAIQASPLSQSRRMRSKEVHYIDHPLMGILIKIKPVEQSSSSEFQLNSGNPAESMTIPTGSADQPIDLLEAPWE